MNLKRRHLTESQRAMVAAKVANFICGNVSTKAIPEVVQRRRTLLFA